MAAIYKAELSRFDAWLAKQPSIKPFNVKYNEMLSDPAPIVREIDAFLGGHLDQQAMCAVVDPSLYRNRAPQSAG
jgi:LPS sulfotransferase NodH